MTDIKRINFYDPKKEYGYLSNFWTEQKQPLIIDRQAFLNTESYFQVMKFRGPQATKIDLEYSKIIQNADSPSKITGLARQKPNHRFGTKWKINKNTDHRLMNDVIAEYKQKATLRKDWNKARKKVMIKALIHKFKQYKHLQEKLLAIPDHILLVEHSKDSTWGDGLNGSGTNYLGKILTALKYVLKYGNCKKAKLHFGNLLKLN